MCQRVSCKKCGKATYRGCGMHVEQVLAGVPRGQRCSCTVQEQAAASGGGLLARLFGRNG